MGSQVVLATAGYDHTIRFWEATSGICYRTLQYADSQVRERVGFSFSFVDGGGKKDSPRIIHELTLLHSVSLLCPLSLCIQVNKLEITADKQLLAAGGNPHVSGNYRAKKKREIFSFCVALVFSFFLSLLQSHPPSTPW